MPENNQNIDESVQEATQQDEAIIQPSDVGIGDLQLDQCLEKEFLAAAPFCPTCIIDENAEVDDWRDIDYDEESYLDKTKCEYVAVVEVKLENVLGSRDIESMDRIYEENRRKFMMEAFNKYNEENPNNEIALTDMFSDNPPSSVRDIIEQAERKARESVGEPGAGLPGYITDTKNGVKTVDAFRSLIDWARDPDRIRLGIKQILDDNDKLNNSKTVCAFGGCQYNIDDVKENRDMINTYIMGLNAASKSVNKTLGSPEYGELGAVADALQALLSPVRFAGYMINRSVAWFADTFSNAAKNEKERKLASRFDGMLTGFFGSDIKNSLERLMATYGTINSYALEWHAYVPDDGVFLLPDTDVLRYIVRVPAFNVDLLPPAEEKDDDAADGVTEAEINLDNSDWRIKFTEMRTGLTLMKYEYDIYRIKYGGSIVFDEEGATSFDMLEFNPVIDSLKTFKKEVEKLLNKNNMAWSYQKGNPFTFAEYFFHKTVSNVRIELKRAEEQQFGKDALEVKDVYLTIEGCPEVKLTSKNIISLNRPDDKTEGSIKSEPAEEADDDATTVSNTESNTIYKKVKYLSKFKTNISGNRPDHTMLFLLSKMSTALMGFQSQEKIPITDWAKDFIFPAITVSTEIPVGDSDADKSTLGCILENFPLMTAESWSSILDDLIVGTWDVFRDELRQRMCNRTEKSIDPGMQRWFASQEVQDASDEAYERAKEELIKAQKKRIEQAVADAKRAGDAQGAFPEEEGLFGFRTKAQREAQEQLDARQEILRKNNLSAEGALAEAATAVVDGDVEGEAFEALADDYDGGTFSGSGRLERLEDSLEIDFVPGDILNDPEKLEAWQQEQLEKTMPGLKANARRIGKTLGDLKRSEHPYMKDMKQTILEQADFENSLIKKFYDTFSGRNLTKPEGEQERFFDYLADIGLCGLILGLKKALGCLFGQIDLEKIITMVVKKIFGKLQITQFVYFMTELLPVEKQLEVQQKVQKKIDEMFEGTVINMGAQDILDPSLYETKKKSPPVFNNAKEIEELKEKIKEENINLANSAMAGSRVIDNIKKEISRLETKIHRLEQGATLSDPIVDSGKFLYENMGVVTDGFATGKKTVGSYLRTKFKTKHQRLTDKAKKLEEEAKTEAPEQAAKKKEKAAKLRLKAKRAQALLSKKKERKQQVQARRDKGIHPKQGSIGQAGAEVFGIILQAYIDSFLDLDVNTASLLDLVRKLPVVSSIPDFVFDMITCPRKSIVEPPLKDIIKFNFKKPNFCDPTRPVVAFNFRGLKWPFKNPWKFLRDAFVAALTKVLTRILIKICVQFLIELEKMLCKMLGSIGKAGLNYATGNFDENALTEAFRDTFCGENASDEEVKKALEGTMATTGATSPDKASEFARKITGAFAGNFTKNEVMTMIFKPKENPALMRRVARVIQVTEPELIYVFEPAEAATNFFANMANVLPIDHKEQIRNMLDEFPLPDTPVFDTICLTDRELDAWNNLREQNLQNRGLSSEDARKQVEKYVDRTVERIEYFMEEADPENLEDTIKNLLIPTGGRDPFGDPDPNQLPPGCEDAESRAKINSMVDEPEELTRLSNKGLDRTFRAVEAIFTKELYAGNNGILSRILSDTSGNSFWLHGFYRNFFITRGTVFDDNEQRENFKGLDFLPFIDDRISYFPKTVGRHLYEEIMKDIEFKSTNMTDAVGKGKISSEYNPFGAKPPLSFKFKLEKHEKAEATIKYQVPVITDGIFTPPEDLTGEGQYSTWRNSVSYASQVLKPEPLMNFDYRIRINDVLKPFLTTGDMRTGANNRYNMHVNQPMSGEVTSYLSEMETSTREKYRKTALQFTLNKIIKTYLPEANITITQGDYDTMISKVLNIFRDICLDIVPRDGQPSPVEINEIDDDGKLTDKTTNVTMPSGFLFGHSNSDFDEEELQYVGPNGEEYDYEEEEQVLGKMKKSNPRIHILDPKKYGGSYKRPPWYVEDPKFDGWLNISKTIAPDIAGCKPAQQNILQMNQIMSHMKKAKNLMKVNSKLFEGRGECFYHIPFDRMLNKESKATIEGCIKTIIRVNVIEQMIGALPIMGFIEYNDINFGSSFEQLVAKRIQEDLATTNVGIFPRKIEKQNYWLSFLEQSVQMFWRMWENQQLDYTNEDGEEELPEYIDDIFTDLRTLQEEYEWKEGMWRNPKRSQGVKSNPDVLGLTANNRKIKCPSYYYDFDKKAFKDPNLTLKPIYGDPVGPFEITRQEYIDASDKVYTEEEARAKSGAYIEYPTAAEIQELADQFEAEGQGEDVTFSWTNPPAQFNGLDVKFARYDRNQTGTEEIIETKPVFDIVGPYDATRQEYALGKDLGEDVPVLIAAGKLVSDDLNRTTENIARLRGGVYEVGGDDPFGGRGVYKKYRKLVIGEEPKEAIFDPFDFQQQYAHYCALAYQSYGDAILYSEDTIEFGESIIFGPLKSSWQFASCMWAVRSVQDKCMIVLSELIKQEMKQIFEIFKEKWEPELLDVNRYLLNTPLFVDNGLKNFGTKSHEKRVATGAISSLGEVSDVVVNAEIESPFDGTDSDMPIKFKIEKYIRVTDREIFDTDPLTGVAKKLPEAFRNRDATLSGVVNVEHFQNYIDERKEEFGEYFISDLFGNSELLYGFKFDQVFSILLSRIKNPSDTRLSEPLEAQRHQMEVDDTGTPTVVVTGIPNNPATGTFTNRLKYAEFFGEYGVILDEDQKTAFEAGALQETFNETTGESIPVVYNDIQLPKRLVKQDWFVASILANDRSNTVRLKPSGITGDSGLKYGMRIIANVPVGSGIPSPTPDNLENSKYALEKSFYTNISDLGAYEKNFAIPIAIAEVDVIDHKIKDFRWNLEGGIAKYPMDIDCLLRKIIKTPEYQIIFKHVMNPSAISSMLAILSSTSFESSIGYKDAWVKLVETEDSEGETQDSSVSLDSDDWQRKYFQDTRMLVRRIFSGFYLANDFEDPDVEAFDFAAIFKAAFGTMFGWMKRSLFGSMSFWWRANMVSNPYDANGEECKSEYDKLLE